MRVAYDHQIFGLQKYGGISRYFFELSENIAKIAGIEVGVLCPLYINAYLASACDCVKVSGRQVPAVRHTARIYRAINQMLAPRMMKRFQPDLVHETHYSAKRYAPANSRVVTTVHDMIHERFPESFVSWDPTFRDKAVAVARADHVVCVSEQTRRDLIELYGVASSRISVVYHGFSLVAGDPVFDQMRGITSRPYLLYVGSRRGYKNFEGLLRAYAANPALQREYDLVAFGGGALEPQERALMQHLGIRAERIRQVGGSDAVLAGLYRRAALFVYPSCYEGFGFPPLEAMSFDCPVACSDASAIPEIVGDAAELFDPNSPDAIGAAIERVLSGDGLREALVMRGRERLKMFSWERCARETLDVYRRLLS